MKIKVLIVFLLLSIISYGRNLTELEEWRQKNLPVKVRNGLLVEIDDIKKISSNTIGIRLRAQNYRSNSVSELIVKVWLWTDEGVWIEEFSILLDDDYNYLNPGREEYYPSKKRHYKIKGIKYENIVEVDLELSRIVSRRGRKK